MPLLKTSGNNTADAYAGGVAAIPNYIEDVFSTYLYTGNNSTKTINNGIDLSTKGGLVWIKSRASAYDNVLIDTARGRSSEMSSDLAYSAATFGSPVASGSDLTSFNTDGFSLGTNYKNTNASGDSLVSWTFRKQSKFFDCFTFVGDGTTNRKIAHSLGSVPGFMLVKSVTTNRTWNVYHRSLGNAQSMSLETTDAAASSTIWNSTTPTATEFTVQGEGNLSGNTYIVYLCAHDAGGFGLTGADNVISCGSYVGDGNAAGKNITLGYEPQYVMVKCTTDAGPWWMFDSMRGMDVNGNGEYLQAQSASSAGTSAGFACRANSTGFTTGNDTNTNRSGSTFIYIAIRKGPMKVPTDGTKVFDVDARSGTGSATTVTTGFPSDMYLCGLRGSNSGKLPLASRLTGTYYVRTPSTSEEADGDGSYYATSLWQSNSLINIGVGGNTPTNASGSTYVDYNFQRAPSFFDEVCYTGTGSTTTISHNLGVAPELIIVKRRDAATAGLIYSSTTGIDKYLALFDASNGNIAAATYSGVWGSSAPTASVFGLGSLGNINASGGTYVAYLFATCAGVSKVGSYTGNGTTQAIACGFAGGARFVLIKRTDSTGDWYVYDTARGMTTLTDPYLLLNSTAAESATLGSVTTTTGGFTVNASILAAINTNAASYIFLAIA